MFEQLVSDPTVSSGLKVSVLAIVALFVANLGLLTTRHGAGLVGRWLRGMRTARWAAEDRLVKRYVATTTEFRADGPMEIARYTPDAWQPGDLVMVKYNIEKDGKPILKIGEIRTYLGDVYGPGTALLRGVDDPVSKNILHRVGIGIKQTEA